MRHPELLGAELKAWLARKRLTEGALAARVIAENKGFRVTQSWISRIVAGKFRRITPSVRCVLDYASIPVAEESERDSAGSRVIDEALSTVWNGSLAHAQIIAKLIKIADEIRPPAELRLARNSRKRARSVKRTL